MKFARAEHIGRTVAPVAYRCKVGKCERQDKNCFVCEKCEVKMTAADWHRVKKEIEYDAGKNDCK